MDAFVLVDVLSSEITFLSKPSINLDRWIVSDHNLSPFATILKRTRHKIIAETNQKTVESDK